MRLQALQPETHLLVEGAGMARPLVPNTSEANRRLNRRVELLLFSG